MRGVFGCVRGPRAPGSSCASSTSKSGYSPSRSMITSSGRGQCGQGLQQAKHIVRHVVDVIVQQTFSGHAIAHRGFIDQCPPDKCTSSRASGMVARGASGVLAQS